MCRRITVCFTLIFFIVSVHGCTSKYRIREGEFEPEREYKYLTVVTVDDATYYFDSGAYLVDDHIECCTRDTVYVQVPVEDIELAYTREFDATKTALYTIGISAIVLLVGGSIALLQTAESIPWVD